MKLTVPSIATFNILPTQVIAAEGEQRSSTALKEAADIISTSPAALQLRYLQTLNTISSEKNSTIIFPVPMEFMQAFIPGGVQNLCSQHSFQEGYRIYVLSIPSRRGIGFMFLAFLPGGVQDLCSYHSFQEGYRIYVLITKQRLFIKKLSKKNCKGYFTHLCFKIYLNPGKLCCLPHIHFTNDYFLCFNI